MSDRLSKSTGRLTEADFVRRVLIVIALLAFAWLLWWLRSVLLLAFGAILIATILHAIGDPIAKRTPLSRTWALPIAGLLILAILGGTAWLFASQVGTQISSALEKAQSAIPTIGRMFGIDGLSQYLSDAWRQAFDLRSALSSLTSYGYTALEVVADIILVIIGGIYLAVSPDLYRNGVVMLLPAGARERTAEALNTTGHALKLWLFGQFFSMVVTGTLTWLAMWLIGLPSASGLGLIAGVTEFIPLLGPFLGAVPAVLIALTQSLTTVLWTILAFVVIQQVEAHLIQPLITRAAVSLPPALLVFAFVAFASLFGSVGILFAAPLTVVAFVFIKKLYVRETLGERTDVPGEA